MVRVVLNEASLEKIESQNIRFMLSEVRLENFWSKITKKMFDKVKFQKIKTPLIGKKNSQKINMSKKPHNKIKESLKTQKWDHCAGLTGCCSIVESTGRLTTDRQTTDLPCRHHRLLLHSGIQRQVVRRQHSPVSCSCPCCS